MLRPEYLDDVIAIRSAYAEYTFIHMLKAPAYDLLEHPNRFPSADVFAVYFVSSYSNKDYSRRDGWNEVLWKMRLGLNQKFMDHAMFFAVKLFDDTRPNQPKEEFNQFFKRRIEHGLLVMENPGLSSWQPQLAAALKQENIFPDSAAK